MYVLILSAGQEMRGLPDLNSQHENRILAYAKTKTQISFAVIAKLISAFAFATRIVQFFFLKPEFQCSSLPL